MKPTPDQLLSAAVAAAERAGLVLMQKLGEQRTVEHKGRIDLVTDADQAAERAAVGVILGRHPDHAILAEEGGATGDSPFRWIIDPLDGTTNYAHAVPHFCVSVACEVDGVVEAGAILDPVRGELFTAAKGRGARLSGAPIRVTFVTEVKQALLATGFPYWVHDDPGRVARLHEAFLGRAQGLRRFGSAALDLAWLACGRYDGYFERSLKLWDHAAGGLIVREAGGIVTALDGGEVGPSGDMLAAGPALHPLLLEIARPHLP